MKKLFYAFLFIVLGVNFTFAQLSDRVNSPSTFKIGTRPVAGNWGIVFAPSYQDFKDIVNRIDGNDTTNVKNVLPVIALRIYSSDNLVFRIGLRSKSSNLKIAGTVVPPVGAINYISELKFQRRNAEFYITPGAEYHFSKSNILDVYVGACIPLGYFKENQTDYMRETGGTPTYSSYERNRFGLAYGFEGFFGIQSYIADLPLSIGLEVGSTALGKLGKKWKVDSYQVVGGIVTNQSFYTLNLDEDDKLPTTLLGNTVADYVSGQAYSKLTAKSFYVDGMARLTLSYYFNK